MRNITIEELRATPVTEQRVELVERKGVGHPTRSATPSWRQCR
jgi:S-adenosylmethionine synthetase